MRKQLNLIKIMKTLFDYEFDKEDFSNFLPILKFSLDSCEDEEKKMDLHKVYDYLCRNQEYLFRWRYESIHLGFDKNELDLVFSAVRDYKPLKMLPEDLLLVQCSCYETLISTYFFFD